METLVVGAGPTGLTAALELARSGVAVKLIEKRQSGSGLSRAVGILPESLKLLGASGATEQLLEEGIKLTSVNFFLGNKPALQLDLTVDNPQSDFILALAQDRTEAILRNQFEALGGKVEFGVELESLRQTNHGVVAEFVGGADSRYAQVIGADGINSTTRSLCGLRYEGFELPETWSIADVEAENWPHNGSFVVCRLNGGNVAVVAQLEPARYRVISNTSDALKTLPLQLDVTHIHRQGSFKISVRQVESYHKGDIFLAGDAAHCHSPVGGRGMNLGISDAVELASHIVNGSTDLYSASRHKYGKSVIALSERGRKIMTSKSAFATIALKTFFAVARKSQIISKGMAKTFLYG